MRPMSFNGWAYGYGNPVKWIDPSGLRPDCGSSIGTLNGFPYSHTCYVTPPKLLVNFHLDPWKKYLRSDKVISGIVQIPVRHPLDLRKEYLPTCDYNEEHEGYINQIRAYYDSDQFTNWELTARLILTEMGSQLGRQEWALRDAIGIVYTVYNRVEWNKYVIPKWQAGTATAEEKGKGYWNPYNQEDTNFGDSNWYSFKKILLSGSQLGIMGRAFTGYTGENLGVDKTTKQRIYEVALIIAYGVDHQIFEDTSFGAQDFRHRPDECSKGDGGPVYFYESSSANSSKNHGLTSGQLWEQQGWSNNEADSNFVPDICK